MGGFALAFYGPRYTGLPVDFIGRREFIENKRATGRPQDRADLDALQPFE